MEQWYLALIRGEKRGPGAFLLRVLLGVVSLLYGLVVRLRNRMYDWGWRRVHRATVPVISIGNLTLGGTGKTPCVEFVARQLRNRDVRLAILSRGYAAGRTSNTGQNDEALLLEQNLPDVPHLQGADRVTLARVAAEELESELLLLDDGFQHRRLHRDLDVVLVDVTRPWGENRLFPRGLLREPMSGLRRAQIVVLTRCDQVQRTVIDKLRERIVRLAGNVDIVETRHEPAGWINAQGQKRATTDNCRATAPVAGFCGIGNPEAFRRTLEDMGLNVVEFRTFQDHHNYTRADVEELHAWARTLSQNCWIATTQKDLVKLQIDQLGGHELWALQIQLRVDAGRELLEARLQSLV